MKIIKHFLVQACLIASLTQFTATAQSSGTLPAEHPIQTPKNPNDIVHLIVEEDAEFPGGRKAMLQYLAENVRYPQIQGCVEGKCTIRFLVTKEGELKDFKVLIKIPGCPECDQEALRVVRSMPKWIPGKNQGKPVNSYYDLPVPFKL